jgi:hypothetical protein
MLLRICLIVALIAGLGAAVASFVVVKPHVEEIISEKKANAEEASKQKSRAETAEKKLKGTNEILVATSTKLSETETQLTAANAKAAEQQRVADETRKDLVNTRQNLLENQQKLAAWSALGIPVEEVKATTAQAKSLREANEVFEVENKTLDTKVRNLQAELRKWTEGADETPILPAGLRGKILVVDPKWDFVVLNIGENKKVLPNGVMMVSREGKLVGKVKITNVQPERSIANVLPGWKLLELSEGDDVIY